jgi:hypothetical protein
LGPEGRNSLLRQGSGPTLQEQLTDGSALSKTKKKKSEEAQALLQHALPHTAA